MKKTGFTITLFLCIFFGLQFPAFAFAHGGRTDSSGGHYNRRTGKYHFHNSGRSSTRKLRYDSSTKPSSIPDNKKVDEPTPVRPTSYSYGKKEKDYSSKWCRKQNGKAEYVLDDGTRVDCLTDEYAVECDFAPKWAEAIGQYLYYTARTGKSPAIILIYKKETDKRYLDRVLRVVKDYNLPIKIWTIGDQ